MMTLLLLLTLARPGADAVPASSSADATADAHPATTTADDDAHAATTTADAHPITTTTAPTTDAPPSPVRFELGTRTSVWAGPYTAAGLGGDLELTFLDTVGVDLFNDNFADPTALGRHEHVIGFSLFTPRLFGGRDGFVTPTLGACVDFRFDHSDDGPSTSSVLFGVHAGARAKVLVLYGFSFQLSAEGYLYAGNGSARSGWTVRTTDGLTAQPVAVISGGIAYAL